MRANSQRRRGGWRTGAVVLWCVAWLAGCAGQTREPWEARWPGAGDLGAAVVSAARSPGTWVPLAAAAVLSVGDLDHDLSDWAADRQPLFGADAESASDDLRRVATAAWVVTALAAPSDSLAGKAGGLTVGVAALGLENAVTGGIKSAAGRRRPDGSDDRSFSSGHAGSAAAAATLARRNLDYLDLPGWADTSLRLGLHGIAAGTGWARVEARRHYATDVLVGLAVGHFVGALVHESFMKPARAPLAVSCQAVPGGGAVTLTLPVGPIR